jgi:hypothetical protein
MTTIEFNKCLELALEKTNHRFPKLSRMRELADPTHNVHLHSPYILDTAFFLIDVTISRGSIRLIETNGSNGALSSTAYGGDGLRARHMALAFESKARSDAQVVALLCHQAGFLHLAEFFARAELFRAELSRRHDTALHGVGELLGSEAVAVVCGSTADLAASLSRKNGQLYYQDRPVAFISNPNLLPELARRGVIDTDGAAYDIDLDPFHEGRCAPLIHDKARQQQLARGTGISPLAYRLVHDRAGWAEAVRWFRKRRMACVAKMHGGSGGTGIELVTMDMDDAATVEALDRLLASARGTYGCAVERTAFPIALFEFAEADRLNQDQPHHLWDIRIMALVQPGGVDCHACVVRLCPAPFDGSWRRETWLSNLTGRDGNQADLFLRSPGELGLAAIELRRVLESCARWSAKAAQRRGVRPRL